MARRVQMATRSRWAALSGVAAFACAAALAPACVEAAPFGLHAGMPLKDMKVVEKLSGDRYYVTVPMPDDEYESYIATVTAKDGLCYVSGIGRTHEADGDGRAVRAAYRRIETDLDAQFGRHAKIDKLNPGSALGADSQFAEALFRHDRKLNTVWNDDGAETLPDDVLTADLEAYGLGGDETYLMVSYALSNFPDCAISKATDPAPAGG